MAAVTTLPSNALTGAPEGQSDTSPGQSEWDERRPGFGSNFNVGALEGPQDTGVLTALSACNSRTTNHGCTSESRSRSWRATDCLIPHVELRPMATPHESTLPSASGYAAYANFRNC